MSDSIRKTKCYATSQDRRGSALLIVLAFVCNRINGSRFYNPFL